MLRSLLGSFFRRTGSTARGPAGQRSLRLERLEERSLLSFNYPLLTVASFGPGAGAYSEAGLIVDAAGNLFGTTYAGGGNGTNNGTLFEVKAGGKRTISTLANFNFSDGSNPLGSLVEDAHGNLFGTTCYGGAGTPYGEGTIFEYSNGRITALASFEGANGANPAAGLVEDAGGNLFGTTSKGGANGDGTVFEYSTTAGTLTTLAAFNGANGACPEANLLEDASGNLFGTAESGGDYRAGTVFEIQAGSGTVTTLGTFNDSNGCAPMGSLVAGANGNLIGTASGGGAAGAGTVFEVDLASRTITTLANFNGTNGAAPMGSLVEDANGNLFGATQHGGTGGFGTVFELPSGTNTITCLASFGAVGGIYPWGGVAEGPAGNLYGTTEGGTNGNGTVFDLPAGNAIAPGVYAPVNPLSYFPGSSDPGPTTAGLYDSATGEFELKDANSAGPADSTFNFGPEGQGWLPIAGDWGGTGAVTVGLYNPANGTFYLKNANSAGPADTTFVYGPGGQGWLPIVGDWDGDGTTTVGLYDPLTGTFFLKDTNSAGPADLTFNYGPGGKGWLPVAGDWDGNGTTTVGLYNPSTSTFFLKDANSAGPADLTFNYGPAGKAWLPVVGDWGASGSTTAGLYNPTTGTFYLKDTNSAGPADSTFVYGAGGKDCAPLVGNWSSVSGASPASVRSNAAKPMAVDSGPAALTPAALAPIVQQAIAAWAAAGAPAAALAQMADTPVVLGELPSGQLAQQVAGQIVVDGTAAGLGGSPGPTPSGAQELATGTSAVVAGELDSRAVDEVDLLTAVEQELGHVAGLTDAAPSTGLSSG